MKPSRFLPPRRTAGVELVEQPLPADNDALLAEIARPVPVCADESVHDRASLDALAGRYDAVNIKLDKTGGLTEALRDGGTAPARSVSRSWWAAWSPRRSPWLLPCSSRKTPTSSISTGRCCSSATARRGSPTRRGMVFPPPPELWG